VQRAGKTLAEAETQIEAFAAAMPHDLRQALRAIIDEEKRDRLANSPVPMTLPDLPGSPPNPAEVEAQAKGVILSGQEPPSAWRPFIHQLDFRATKRENLRLLSNLTSLEFLDLRRTQISDVSPIKGLTGLIHLDLARTPVSDISSLSGLTVLKYLDLENTAINDFSPISGMTKLKHLVLRDTLLIDLPTFHDFFELTHLDLSNTKFRDTFKLSFLTKLKHLNLADTEVDGNLFYLVHLTELEYLNLSGTAIDNLSDLSRLTSLKQLILRRSRGHRTKYQIEDLQAILPNLKIDHP
jgi:Leucine-rich repeat (LRR) protein